MNKDAKIAIIGAGVAGSSAALYLSKLGLDVTIFEQNSSIISGPPICHLHAGGNLYPDISNEECKILLKESIDLLKFYPDSIDFRPTVIAIPKSYEDDPQDFFERLEFLKNEYKKLIQKDSSNQVLCKSDDYYKLYSKEQLIALKQNDIVKEANCFDDWMVNIAKNVDLDKLKFPLIAVQEYGLNIFRLASIATLHLNNIRNATLKTNTKVINIKQNQNRYDITYKTDDKTTTSSYDYIINAAGFKTGIIDDMLGFKQTRMVEFKAAYVTQWDDCKGVWPEVIFHGLRGTPQGMAQFTPYPNGHFQIHGMTQDITLFENGLVKSTSTSSYAKLDDKFLDMIEKSWDKKEIQNRTNKAIEHIKQYIPTFQNVKVASKPLFGAQQIPGTKSNLRTADVSFEGKTYARCEIVKASSVLSMIDQIVKNLIDINILPNSVYGTRDILKDTNLNNEDINKTAKKLCIQRSYPQDISNVINSINRCF